MPLFNGQLLHCLLIGTFFGVINYSFSYLFFKRYSLLKELNKDLTDSLSIDKLTGVLNRRSLESDMHQIESYGSYSLLFLDIDNFRDFNNLYGHQIGDRVLRRVCDILKVNLRNCDMVYRYGGEEILVCLKDCDKENAIAVGEKIRSKVSMIDNSPFPPITVSVGVACSSEDGQCLIDTIKAADIAMLSAKKKGKNSVVAYNRSLAI